MATETDLEAANRRIADGTRRIADLKAYIELFGANVISSPFIGVDLTSWKARTLP